MFAAYQHHNVIACYSHSCYVFSRSALQPHELWICQTPMMQLAASRASSQWRMGSYVGLIPGSTRSVAMYNAMVHLDHALAGRQTSSFWKAEMHSQWMKLSVIIDRIMTHDSYDMDRHGFYQWHQYRKVFDSSHPQVPARLRARSLLLSGLSLLWGVLPTSSPQEASWGRRTGRKHAARLTCFTFSQIFTDFPRCRSLKDPGKINILDVMPNFLGLPMHWHLPGSQDVASPKNGYVKDVTSVVKISKGCDFPMISHAMITI